MSMRTSSAPPAPSGLKPLKTFDGLASGLAVGEAHRSHPCDSPSAPVFTSANSGASSANRSFSPCQVSSSGRTFYVNRGAGLPTRLPGTTSPSLRRPAIVGTPVKSTVEPHGQSLQGTVP